MNFIRIASSFNKASSLRATVVMSNLSKMFREYILDLRLRLLVFFQLLGVIKHTETPIEINPTPVPESTYATHMMLSSLLRASYSRDVPNIHSSDKGLLSSHVYGRNIQEYIYNLKNLLTCLMVDTLVDHDKLVAQRDAVFLKNYFYANGVFLDTEKSIRECRDIAIRLTEGYELRRLHPDLGLNTHQNLITTHQVLVDLTEFFTEIYNGNRNDLVSGARSDNQRIR